MHTLDCRALFFRRGESQEQTEVRQEDSKRNYVNRRPQYNLKIVEGRNKKKHLLGG